ncbi:unnamed protein product [Mortierella alpina]
MASTTAALSVSGSASGAGPSSLGSTVRSSSGGRSSMAEASTHRLSIGNRRLSQLPPKNNNALTSLLPLPQFDSDEIHAHAAAFTNEFNSYTQKTKAKITESSEQWDRETAELQEHDRALREDLKVATLQEAALAKALNREKEEAGNMSKTIQQLSARREEMRQMQASLESQVSLLRKEVKAKREGMGNSSCMWRSPFFSSAVPLVSQSSHQTSGPFRRHTLSKIRTKEGIGRTNLEE